MQIPPLQSIKKLSKNFGSRQACCCLVILGLLAACGASLCRAGEAGSKPPMPKIILAADGRHFQTEDGRPFHPMGVNYFRPGTGWAPQLWKKFDAEATRRDFARMKELGVNCVRVFLTYGSFFMESDRLAPEGLAKFDQLLEIAEAAGIYIHPTGPDHWEGTPAWAQSDSIADDRALEGLENFWRQFAGRYRGRNVLFSYDLRNEPSVAWDTPALRAKWNRWLETHYGSAEKAAQAWGVAAEKIRWGNEPSPAQKESPGSRQLLDYQHFREDIADEWTRRQAAAIKSADPRALVTVGLIQWSVPALLPGVQHYAAFRPQRQAKFLDFLEVHFYPLADGFYEYRRPEDEARNLAYLESVVREVAAAGKPVVLAEFGWYGGGQLTIDGGRHPAAAEEQQARWCSRAVEVTQDLATGWLNWGFYDHPQAGDVSQLTGLLTVEGKPKAWAREFRRLSGSLASVPASRQLGPRPTLDWDRCLTSLKAAQQFRDEYFKAFQANRVSAGATEEGFTSLFDGKTLNGWTIHCLPKDREQSKLDWTVEGGTILADTIGRKDHFYILLGTNKEYGDFVLRLRFQVPRGVTGNSGIQIRSRYNAQTGWMEGPQIDINPPDPQTTGKLWNEGPGLHRWLSNERIPGFKFFYADQGDGWNDMEITAQGMRIKSVLNGVTVVDYDGSGVLDDDLHKKANVGTKGVIGLQIHMNDELKLRFKDIRIKEL